MLTFHDLYDVDDVIARSIMQLQEVVNRKKQIERDVTLVRDSID